MKNLIISIAILFLFLGCKAEPEQSRSQSYTIAENDPTSDVESPIITDDATDDTQSEPITVDPTTDTAETPIIPDPTTETIPEVVAPDRPIQQEQEVIIPDQPEQEDPTADIPVIINPVKLALLTGTGALYFYDGTNFYDMSSDSPKHCGFRCFTNGNVLNNYDASGQIISSFNLIVAPTLISKDATTGTTVIVENVDPATAYSLWALYKDYTKTYVDGVEVGNWMLNRYTTKELIRIGTDYLTKDQFGKIRDVNETLLKINAANGLIVHNIDPVKRLATIRTDQNKGVSWSTNAFNQAKQWQFADGRWFSQNGYEFYNGSLVENANALTVFNGQVAISSGTRMENSETVLYWIEASAGWLYRYIRSTNRLEQVARIYLGDGTRQTGFNNADILKPVLIGHELFFNYSGSVWKLDIDSGFIGIFYGGGAEVLKW